MECIQQTPCKFLLAVVAVWTCFADGAQYRHLGCYLEREEPNLRDINGLDITTSDVNLHELLETCRTKGYPYAGFQALPSGSFKCYCGDSYGRWGKAPNSALSCNYTCTPNSNLACGGILANDVYYTIRADDAYTSTLVSVYQPEGKVYVKARRQCVQNGGDLLTMPSTHQINDSVSLINNGGMTTGHVWFGLRNRFMNSSKFYEWVDPGLTFILTDYQAYFKDNAILNSCVNLLPEDRLWKSTDCHIKYPSMCKQLNPELLATTPVPKSASGLNDEDEEGSVNLLSVYIVLPLCAFCYCGSCVSYTIYKVHKLCKKKSKDKMLLSNIEYEPHNKPRLPPPPGRPSSGHKGRVFPAPPNGMPPQRPSNRPPGIAKPCPPPPMISPRKTPLGTSPTNSSDSTSGSRPATSRAVELDMKERTNVTPRPAVSSDARPMSKAEKRREKLLENALKEARERNSKVGVTPDGRHSQNKPPKLGEDPADSGDSTTNLLITGNSDPPSRPPPVVDRSKMSIREILKLKLGVNANRKRPKKILQA